jgi:hypothetical protein
MVRNELYCHNCDTYVTIDMSVAETGNLTVTCPRCLHEHYRYVEQGVITGERWRSSSSIVSYRLLSYSNSSTGTTSTASDSFTRDSWYNTGTGDY